MSFLLPPAFVELGVHEDVLRGPQTGNAVLGVTDPDPAAFPRVPGFIRDDEIDKYLAALTGREQWFTVRATTGSTRTFRGGDDVTALQGFLGLALT
jgi:hypothetical protein